MRMMMEAPEEPRLRMVWLGMVREKTGTVNAEEFAALLKQTAMQTWAL